MTHYLAPGSIVVGIDGSAHADRAARWAAEEASLEQRPLTIVAVSRSASGLADLGTLTEEATGLAHALAPAVAVEHRTLLGDPRQELIDLSAHAHLLVVGSRGHGTLRGMLLGSVSTAVSREAACPVVVSRPPADQVTRGVVVGADGTPESLPVIEFAFDQASVRGLPVTVVHCFCDVVAAAAELPELSGVAVNETYLEELRVVLAESVAGLREKYPDVQAALAHRRGLVDEVLAPRRRAWELVVVGRHPACRGRPLLSAPISTAVIERSRSNVAVVPQAGSRT